MASSSSSLHFLILLFFLSFFSCQAQPVFRPTALVLPVRKDAATNQYVTVISQRTPRVPITLVVHLGGQSTWVDCFNYVSSTYRPVRCLTPQCPVEVTGGVPFCGSCFSTARPGCSNNSCLVFPYDPLSGRAKIGHLAQDAVAIPTTNGSITGPPQTSNQFLFSCASDLLIQGIARGATGFLGLGRGPIGAPAVLTAAFNFRRVFSVCLSPTMTGAMFFGPGPYFILPGFDAAESLRYTPLYTGYNTEGISYPNEGSLEYYVRINAIRINNTQIPINNTLLNIDSLGRGGTKISTVTPYTLLRTSIYREFTSAFIREAAARNMTRVAGVEPFEVCFSTANVLGTPVGWNVPYIDLVMQEWQGRAAVWTITGSNSIVQVSNDVLCLGFLDGGVNPMASIVIGGLQLEDNFVQFDLENSRLGFSNSLLWRPAMCANYNTTASARV